MSKELKNKIGRKIMDPQKLQFLLDYPDAYGDMMLEKLMDKCKSSKEIAFMFGFDEEYTTWLLTLHDLVWEKTKEEDGIVSKERMLVFTSNVVKEVLEDLNEEIIEKFICSVKRMIEGKHASAEELIVKVVQKIYDHADQIEDKNLRILYRLRLLHKYQDQIIKTKQILDYTVPEIPENVKLRVKVNK